MRIVTVGLADGSHWDVVADELDWLGPDRPEGVPQQRVSVDVVWHYAFWRKTVVKETRRLQIDFRWMVWCRELRDVHSDGRPAAVG